MTKKFEISPTTRLRRSPFFDATVREGVTGFYPYNNMLMPTGFGHPEEEYWRIINGVSMWDVGVQRQVAGPCISKPAWPQHRYIAPIWRHWAEQSGTSTKTVF